MAVSEVELTSQGASGAASGESPLDVKASYTSTYKVICDSQIDSPTTVLKYFATHGSLPWMGRPFKFGNVFDVNVTCRNVKADYVDKSAGQFLVSCTFESPGTEDGGQQKTNENGQNTTDPTQWHDEIEFSYQNTTTVAETGIFRQFYNGSGNKFFAPNTLRPITNSAGVPFNPPLEKETAIRVLRLTKYSAQSGATLADGYINAVNSDAFTVYKPAYGFSYFVNQYCGKIKNYSTAFAIENGIRFWREVLELHINPNGWRRWVLDIGYHRRLAYGDKYDDGTTVGGEAFAVGWVGYGTITDKSNIPISTPIPLDGNGQPLAHGKPQVYLQYSVEEERSFSAIKW